MPTQMVQKVKRKSVSKAMLTLENVIPKIMMQNRKKL